MSYFKRILALATIFAFALPCVVMAQFPPVPDKSPALAVPSKSVPQAAPLASPRVQVQASPQQAYAPQQSFAPVAQYDQPAVVLEAAPQVFAIQRQIAFAPVAYAACDTGCVAQQQVVVQRNVIQRSFVGGHGVQRQVFVNRGLVGHAGFGQQRSKTVTRTVTKARTGRGLFGR